MDGPDAREQVLRVETRQQSRSKSMPIEDGRVAVDGEREATKVDGATLPGRRWW